MKRSYLYILIAINSIFLGGCDNFSLDISPEDRVTDENYWKSVEQFETFATGIHHRLRTHAYNMFLLGDLRSDIFGDTPFAGEATQGIERLWLNSLNSENPGISNYAGFYTNINQINLFISKLKSSNLLQAKDNNYFLGQAYGLRALYYFHLHRSWGNVIITTEPSITFDIANLSKSASEASEVLNFIKADIDSSLQRFSDDYSFRFNDKGFWSKAASLMLKSEVYLWSSKQSGGGIADATAAKAAIIDIQTNLPSLGLMLSFKDVFAYGQKGNKEIIFAMRFKNNEFNMFDNSLVNNFLPQNSYLGNYYDSLANARINKTIENYSGLLRAPIKKTTFWRFSNLDTRKLVSIKGAYNLTGANYVLAGCYLYKYQGVDDGTGTRKMADDYPVYRYADLLLMLAEAKSILGEDPTTEINLVRQRAFGSNYQASVLGYPNQPGDNDINEVLLKERFFEFIGEGKRWYDLRRFGKQYVFKYTMASQDYQLLWPVDKTTLTNNKALTQTHGY